MPDKTSIQHQAVILRLQKALLEVALCETWLKHYAPTMPDHQEQANSANDRVLALSQLEGTRR